MLQKTSKVKKQSKGHSHEKIKKGEMGTLRKLEVKIYPWTVNSNVVGVYKKV